MAERQLLGMAKRLRRRGDDTVAKLRPIVPGELPQPPFALRHVAREN